MGVGGVLWSVISGQCSELELEGAPGLPGTKTGQPNLRWHGTFFRGVALSRFDSGAEVSPRSPKPGDPSASLRAGSGAPLLLFSLTGDPGHPPMKTHFRAAAFAREWRCDCPFTARSVSALRCA